METDEDHATMRESFSLVQNILFIEYTDTYPAHEKENMVEKLWKAMQFGLFFWKRTLEGASCVLTKNTFFQILSDSYDGL